MPTGIYKRKPRGTLESRFWKYVEKTESCWNWMGSKSGKIGNQYGSLHYRNKMEKAHRISWQIHQGEILEGLFVLHKCDNPICVRPSHLFLGTQTDNMRDMDAKGRRVSKPPKGEKHYGSKLTDKTVIRIREMYKSDKYTQYDLADLFSVAQGQIQTVVNYKSWKHVA